MRAQLRGGWQKIVELESVAGLATDAGADVIARASKFVPQHAQDAGLDLALGSDQREPRCFPEAEGAVRITISPDSIEDGQIKALPIAA